MENSTFLNSDKFRATLFYLAVLGVFASGLFYILSTDLIINQTSKLLIYSVVYSMGGSIIFAFGNTFKGKLYLYYPLKIAGLALSALFILFIVFMMQDEAQVVSKEQFNLTPFYIIMMGLTGVSVVCQLCDILLSFAYGVEE